MCTHSAPWMCRVVVSHRQSPCTTHHAPRNNAAIVGASRKDRVVLNASLTSPQLFGNTDVQDTGVLAKAHATTRRTCHVCCTLCSTEERVSHGSYGSFLLPHEHYYCLHCITHHHHSPCVCDVYNDGIRRMAESRCTKAAGPAARVEHRGECNGTGQPNQPNTHPNSKPPLCLLNQINEASICVVVSSHPVLQ